MRAVAVEAEALLAADPQRQPVPIRPFGRADDRSNVERGAVQTPDARERFAHDRLLGFELGPVVDMLPAATAALGYVGARRWPAHSGRFEYLEQLGFAVVSLVVDDARAHDVARGGIGNEDHAALRARDAEHTVGEGFDFDRQLFHAGALSVPVDCAP